MKIHRILKFVAVPSHWCDIQTLLQAPAAKLRGGIQLSPATTAADRGTEEAVGPSEAPRDTETVVSRYPMEMCWLEILDYSLFCRLPMS